MKYHQEKIWDRMENIKNKILNSIVIAQNLRNKYLSNNCLNKINNNNNINHKLQLNNRYYNSVLIISNCNLKKILCKMQEIIQIVQHPAK